MRISFYLLLLVLIISCHHSTKPASDINDDERAIRETRELSNQAIAAHDTVHIGDPWMDDFILLTSTDKNVLGKADNIASFTQHFKERPDVIYVRTPDQVQVFEAWGMASEFGYWEGSWSDQGFKTEIGGTYYAKWHKVKNKWLLRSEIFTPTHCKGGEYCTRQNK